MLDYISTLGWPVAFLVALLVFRKKIAAGLGRLSSLPFSKIKIWELEAEVERVQKEAGATIFQLKALALSLSEPVGKILPGILHFPSSHEFYSTTAAERWNHAHAIYTALIELGAAEHEADKIALAPIRTFLNRAHYEYLKREFNKVYNGKIDKDLNELLNVKIIDDLIGGSIQPDYLRASIEEVWHEMPKEVEERLKDLSHFMDNDEIRRPETHPWGDHIPNQQNFIRIVSS